jgi:gliding motility-associated-like protein
VPLPEPVINGTTWKCRGVRDTLTVTNLNGPATYVWSDGKTTTTIYTGLIDADSTFTVIAYNKLGCPGVATYPVSLRSPLTITLPPPTTFCAGQPVCISADVAGNPLSPVSYLWSDGETTSTICPTIDSATAFSVTVSNGCKSTKSTILSPNFPNLTACCNQIVSIINDTVSPPNVIVYAQGNSVHYTWAPTGGTCLDPPLCDSMMYATPSVTTTYTVTGTDANGCEIAQLITITVDVPCFNLVIPNVFTPTNGGTLGLDKVFYIDSRNMDAWSITIFDRWGKQMFTSTDPSLYWNGNTPSGGAAPAGVYYYIISATCQNTGYKKDGFVQLIR